MNAKKLLCLLLSVLLLVGMVPAFATAATIVDSGTCGANGDNLTWTLDSEGTLTISGTGAMNGYSHNYSPSGYYTTAPWGGSVANGNRIKSVVIENGVTSIGGSAFSDCSSLMSVTIPDSVTSFGDDIFSGISVKPVIFCNRNSAAETWAQSQGLPFALLDGTAEETTVSGYAGRLNWTINKLTGVLTISGTGIMPPFTTSRPAWEDYFPYFHTVVIEEGVTTVSDLAFSQDPSRNYYESSTPWYFNTNNSRIRTVKLPKGLTSIGEGAFFGVDTLREINIPAGVTSIGDGAFMYCRALKEITLPDSVTALGYGVFNNCRGLQKAILPAGLTAIPRYLFYNCSALAEVEIPAGVTTIGESAFYGCGFAEIALPDVLTSIGSYSFNNCNKLTSVTIPAAVTSISESAFYDCDALETVSFSEDCTGRIDYRAFYNCGKLAALHLGGATAIGEEAFMNCKALADVTLPGSVQRVENRAFAFCDALTALRFMNPEMTLSYSKDYYEYNGQKIQNMITPVNTVIYGYDGSTAQEYADTFNLMYLPIACEDGNTHDFEKTAAPACGATGLAVYTCKHCGKAYIMTETVNHLPGEAVRENVVPVTCTVNGSYDEVTYCTVCNAELSRNTRTEWAKGHTYAEPVRENEVPATCTENGSYDEVIYCPVCGLELSRRTARTMLGPHTLEKIEAKAATCTEAGNVAYYTCSVCGKNFSDQNGSFIIYNVTIAANGHSFGEWVVTKAPTFTEEGVETRTCATCGATETRPVAKLQTLPGDVSGDGKVTAEDARLALRAAVGLETYAAGSPEFLAADATGDGKITAEDARLILRRAVGFVDAEFIG